MPVRASIVVQRKENVLIVPTSAVKTVGRRTFVEYFDGTRRRSANVEVGIVTATEAEIVKGLQEGQVILAGQ
jgi:multidrug efflux pump subunit AcrA (membrane-fusion protein)